ncbi:MAG: beta-ketoacyl synthase N-terminal-like domain-containing protein, partial [Cellulosimicrobium cellulans]
MTAPGAWADAPVVVAARRTWVGTAGHGHRSLAEVDLAAGALGATLDDARSLGFEADVADVVLGCCTGPGGNVARPAALAAGLGVAVPGLTVDRQCGSGLAAVLLAAQQVRAGEARLVLAGGTESASRAPARAHRTPWGDVPYARAAFAPTPWADPGMGAAADALARRRGVTRERQEAYAVRSHARALAAHAGGRFTAETVRVGAPGRALARDERARHLDPAVLVRLSPAFTPGGTVTAATASPVSDGAAAVAVVA